MPNKPDSPSPMTVRLMKTVRLGAARFVITTIVPPCSRMKRRLVSPGGATMQTGELRDTVGKAFARVYPYSGGEEGRARVVLGTRTSAAESSVARNIARITQIFIKRAFISTFKLCYHKSRNPTATPGF